jgi:hypothetical protein
MRDDCTSTQRPLGFCLDERGSSSLEYIFFFAAVSLLLSATVIAIGPDLVDLFRLRAAWLSLPVP